MPRPARKESGTGIYHVMLRGINRQDIFEDEEDYMRMLRCLQQMIEQYDDRGNRLPPPVKAGLVSRVGDYDWSSWKEYTEEVPAALGLCATDAILNRMSFDDLKELVEAPLDDDVQCLDLDECIKISVGDR